MTKASLIAALPETMKCLVCSGVMTKEQYSPDKYACPECTTRVWADPIGEGLVRYAILRRQSTIGNFTDTGSGFDDFFDTRDD